jgi:hypothetical protein
LLFKVETSQAKAVAVREQGSRVWGDLMEAQVRKKKEKK